jgi:hypothetical protein
MNGIELTVEEKALLDRIDFAPASPEKHDSGILERGRRSRSQADEIPDRT